MTQHIFRATVLSLLSTCKAMQLSGVVPVQVVDLSKEAAVRPARRAAVAMKPLYKEELSSEEEQVESDDADANFEASD